MGSQPLEKTYFSLWFSTAPEIRLEALRFLDLRNIQRLKLVCLDLKRFVHFYEDQWPKAYEFDVVRIAYRYQLTIERHFNASITVVVCATVDNCPTKYLKLVDENVNIKKFERQMSCNDDQCHCNLDLCGRSKLPFFNRLIIFARPGIRLFLQMPQEICSDNLRMVFGWLLYLAHEWKFGRYERMESTRRRQIRWPTTVLLQKFIEEMDEDEELESLYERFLS